MKVLISGGCKSGKSYHAQELARDIGRRPMYYVATMFPRDKEDRARIRRHRAEREGWGFITLEQPYDICECLRDPDVDAAGVFLVDSVTALMAEEMFGRMRTGTEVRDDLLRFAGMTGDAIFVSDYIYADGVDYDEQTAAYMRALAAADRALAEICDHVIEMVHGCAIEYKTHTHTIDDKR